MAVTEIRSYKAFRKWLREHGHQGQWFGRIGFDQRSLLVSRGRVWRFRWDKWTHDQLPLYPLRLPAISPANEAKAWWSDIFEQQICGFFRAAKLPIYCMARMGTWHALPDWCVLRSKAEWVAITKDEFNEQVNEDVRREMIAEHTWLGISVRELRLPTETRNGR
jgi:hypothetical protein